MGISASPAIWQQFVDHIIQELKYPDDYKIIMDDALVFTTVANHTEHLQDLFLESTQKQDKNAKINVTPPKQAITRQEQTDITVNDNIASITNTTINPLHPGLCDI